MPACAAGPTAPLSPHSPRSPNPSVLSSRSSVLTARPPPAALASTGSRTPSPATPSTAVEPGKPAFFDKFRDTVAPLDTAPALLARIPNPYGSPQSPSSGSDYEGGLAYADSEDDDDDDAADSPADGAGAGAADEDSAVLTPLSPPQETTVLAPAAVIDELVTAKNNSASGVRFPTVDEKRAPKSALKKSPSASSAGSSASGSGGLVYGSPRTSARGGHERSGSANSAASGSNYSASTARSTHALDRAMETLFEETASASASPPAAKKAGRSNTIPGLSLEPTSPDAVAAHKAPKLPARSLTGPSSHHGHGHGHNHVTFAEDVPAGKRGEEKRKECVRCERVIEDGRWIQTDAGGVLCERCWKNMYLPKCRRCNLPIEKQA
ncbi:hypothetical protein HWV62_8359, partial [Athelia sp. TMB]